MSDKLQATPVLEINMASLARPIFNKYENRDEYLIRLIGDLNNETHKAFAEKVQGINAKKISLLPDNKFAIKFSKPVKNAKGETLKVPRVTNADGEIINGNTIPSFFKGDAGKAQVVYSIFEGPHNNSLNLVQVQILEFEKGEGRPEGGLSMSELLEKARS